MKHRWKLWVLPCLVLGCHEPPAEDLMEAPPPVARIRQIGAPTADQPHAETPHDFHGENPEDQAQFNAMNMAKFVSVAHASPLIISGQVSTLAKAEPALRAKFGFGDEAPQLLVATVDVDEVLRLPQAIFSSEPQQIQIAFSKHAHNIRLGERLEYVFALSPARIAGYWQATPHPLGLRWGAMLLRGEARRTAFDATVSDIRAALEEKAP